MIKKETFLEMLKIALKEALRRGLEPWNGDAGLNFEVKDML